MGYGGLTDVFLPFSMERIQMSNDTPEHTTKPVPPEATAKPSSGDYPVEPAERVSQQERLRKAAAAGASALKSPMPSIMSRLPSPQAGTPQKSSESLAPSTESASSTEATPNPHPAPFPEITADRKVALLQINDTEEILAELRKISAWAGLQRKITKWSFIVLAVFIPALIAVGIWMQQRVQANLEGTASPQQPDWYDVDHNVRAGDFDKAIRIGEELILKTPQYPEAHQRLAGAYLASGNIEKAREHYAEAFRLFPSEENEKRLIAIDKRNKSDQP
jgi:tetratricopeptide (TPR) repeat protein